MGKKRALPVYRVSNAKGAEIVILPEAGAQPAAKAPRVGQLPQGAVVLVHERVQRQDSMYNGWWLRLAGGAAWIRQDVTEEAQTHTLKLKEAQDWLQKAASLNDGIFRQNAQAVVA